MKFLINLSVILIVSQFEVSNCNKRISQSGAWCWFGDPRAVYDPKLNRTYVGFITHTGEIVVDTVDYKTGRINTSIIEKKFKVDDHSTPTIYQRPDKHFLVFWSGHGGPKMFYRRSIQPNDATQWGPINTLPSNTKGSFGYTYPNPVTLSGENNVLYLFWRGGNFNPTYSKLAAGAGQNWTQAQTLITMPGQRPYVKVISDEKDTIHFAFTQAHPRNMLTNIYHMYYRKGQLYHTDGRVIGPMGVPIKPDQATLVYNASISGIRAWIHDIAMDSQGFPVLTFATIINISDHRYHFARWTGFNWFQKEIAKAGASISENPSEPQYTAGITINKNQPNVIFLSRPVKDNGIHEIERWTTEDGGNNWTKFAITSNSSFGQVRPVPPRNAPISGPGHVFWMAGRYPHYLKFMTHIMRSD